MDEHGGLLRDSLGDYVKVPKDIQVELDAAGYDVDPEFPENCSHRAVAIWWWHLALGRATSCFSTLTNRKL